MKRQCSQSERLLPRTLRIKRNELRTRKEYDLTDSIWNPYAERFRKQVMMRLGTDVIEYFKALVPYQNLTSLYRRDCAHAGKRLTRKRCHDPSMFAGTSNLLGEKLLKQFDVGLDPWSPD